MKNKTLDKYLFWVFALGWAVQIPASLLALRGQALAFQVLTALSMFAPLAAALLAKAPLGALGWMPKLRGRVRWYLVAWLAPVLLTAMGAALYFRFVPESFDPGGKAYLASLPEAARLQFETQTLPFYLFVLLSAVGTLSYAPFINAALALGEEVGWRGVLYPRLKKRLGPVRGRLLGGAIWGVWHWPLMILAGYEYGLHYWGSPWLGPPLFCLFTTACGVLFDWLYEKTGSIWAPSLAHGAVNAAANLPVLFLASGYAERMILGPVPYGLVAGLPLTLLAAAILLQTKTPTRDNFA